MSRDNQLSSSMFDGEIANLLKVQLVKSLSHFAPSVVRNHQPELDLLLNGSVFFLTFGAGSGVSAGQELQNVRYVKMTKLQLVLLGLLNVLGPYAWARIREYILHERWEREEGWKQSVFRWMTRLEMMWKVAVTLNFLAFLASGRYPQLSERLLRISMESISPDRPRSVAFDFMNRQLVWQGLTEFLLFFAPLIDFGRIQKLFHQAVVNPNLAADECGICGAIPMHNPHGSKVCRHPSCYFCIAQKLEEEEGGDYPCPKCGVAIVKKDLIRLSLAN